MSPKSVKPIESFRFIRTVEDFEAVVRLGDSREGLQLEVKQKRIPNEELASTVAALANASGGYLIIGLAEDTEKRISKVCPVTGAQALVRQMNDAIDNHTWGFERSPEIEVVDLEEGTVVVVNVAASARLIALRCKGKINQISYPVRHDEQTLFLRPYDVEQRILGYAPRVRLLQVSDLCRELRSENPGGPYPCVLHTYFRDHSGGLFPTRTAAAIHGALEWGLALELFDVVVAGQPQASTRATAPAEWVSSVWIGAADRSFKPQLAETTVLHLSLEAQIYTSGRSVGFTPNLRR